VCRYLQPSFLKSYISSSNLIRKDLLHKYPKKMKRQISLSLMQVKMEINRKQFPIIIHLLRPQQLTIKSLKTNRKLLQSKSPPNNQMHNQSQITA
jgi:hypothetical protein